MILVNDIEKAEMRYDTVGDWDLNSLGDIYISVAKSGNRDYDFLVGLHEMIEAYLCVKRGIAEASVTEFDMKHPDANEPGDLIDAPYRKEHRFAENIERLVALELGVDWLEYEEKLHG